MTVGYRQQAVLPKDLLLYQTDGVMGSFLLTEPRGQCSPPSVRILSAKDPLALAHLRYIKLTSECHTDLEKHLENMYEARLG